MYGWDAVNIPFFCLEEIEVLSFYLDFVFRFHLSVELIKNLCDFSNQLLPNLRTRSWLGFVLFVPLAQVHL